MGMAWREYVGCKNDDAGRRPNSFSNQIAGQPNAQADFTIWTWTIGVRYLRDGLRQHAGPQQGVGALKPSAGFNPFVHGARGLFSAMVFVFHVYNSRLPSFPAVKGSLLEIYLLDSMKFGVELFFGISGLVIVGALARAPSTGVFVWDRIARIFPVLWVSLLVITLMHLVAGQGLPSLGLWAANFLVPPPFFKVPMVHPAAWSLGYEFTFYMLCALLWTLRGVNIRAWTWIAVLFGTALIILYPRSILMAAGVMIAAGTSRPRGVDWLARFPLLMIAAFLMLWRMIDLASPHGVMELNPVNSGFDIWAKQAPALLLAGVAGGIGLLGVEQGKGVLGSLLKWRPIQWLGTISYSFYLWHPICMAAIKFAMHKFGLVDVLGQWSQVVFLISALLPSLFISHWSQILLEKRVTRWLRALDPAHRSARLEKHRLDRGLGAPEPEK